MKVGAVCGEAIRRSKNMEMMFVGGEGEDHIQHAPGLIPRAHINVFIGDTFCAHHFQSHGRWVLVVAQRGVIRTVAFIVTLTGGWMLQEGRVSIHPKDDDWFRATP